MSKRISLEVDGQPYELTLSREGDRVTLAGTCGEQELSPVTTDLVTDGSWTIVRLDGKVHRCLVAGDNHGIWVSLRGRNYYLESKRAASAGGGTAGAASSDEIRAPMTGTLLSIHVEVGARVAQGDLLAVMEAMKMEYRLEAPEDGTVERVEASPGDMLDVGTLIVKLQSATPE